MKYLALAAIALLLTSPTWANESGHENSAPSHIVPARGPERAAPSRPEPPPPAPSRPEPSSPSFSHSSGTTYNSSTYEPGSPSHAYSGNSNYVPSYYRPWGQSTYETSYEPVAAPASAPTPDTSASQPGRYVISRGHLVDTQAPSSPLVPDVFVPGMGYIPARGGAITPVTAVAPGMTVIPPATVGAPYPSAATLRYLYSPYGPYGPYNGYSYPDQEVPDDDTSVPPTITEEPVAPAPPAARDDVDMPLSGTVEGTVISISGDNVMYVQGETTVYAFALRLQAPDLEVGEQVQVDFVTPDARYLPLATAIRVLR